MSPGAFCAGYCARGSGSLGITVYICVEPTDLKSMAQVSHYMEAFENPSKPRSVNEKDCKVSNQNYAACGGVWHV